MGIGVGDGVGGIGVCVSAGMAVGGKVAVMMKGVAVPASGICKAHPHNSRPNIVRAKFILCIP